MSEENIYKYITLTTAIGLIPEELNSEIDNVLLDKLKESIENKCIKEGYVVPNTIKIIKRGLGTVLTSHFNGNVIYNINYSVQVCNPMIGNIINAKIVNLNKMGILANSGGENNPLAILLAKQHHIDNELYESLNVGNNIKIKVIGIRFDKGESKINIIGTLISKV